MGFPIIKAFPQKMAELHVETSVADPLKNWIQILSSQTDLCEYILLSKVIYCMSLVQEALRVPVLVALEVRRVPTLVHGSLPQQARTLQP